MKYLKVWTSFRDLLQPLNDDEIGRLFLMMLSYAETGEIPQTFIGNEAFLFPVAKQMIDLAAEKAETLRHNGSKGGIAKSKNKQEIANDSKSKQTIANDSNEEQNVAYKEKKRNEIESNEKKSLLSEDDAHEFQREQNRVLDAAEDAGFKMSNDVRSALIALYADHGLDRMLEAMKSCVEHGATNLAYLKAVLKGKPKQTKVVVNAQDFGQRDYSDVESQMMDDLAEEMKAFKGAG